MLASPATLKRCRAPSGGDEYTPAARAYHMAPMKALLQSARRDFYLQAQREKAAQEEEAKAVAVKEEAKAVAVKEEEEESVTLGSEESELDRKCRRLAELIAGSKHLVAFTGAGISTSVGIPDYRGEHGIRTKKFERVKSKKRRKAEVGGSDEDGAVKHEGDGENEAEDPKVPDFHLLVPSTTHMALFELHRLGYLKHIVSQNVDNLHLKSGVPAQALTEVHGNATQAKCETCEKIYTPDAGFPWTGLCDDVNCVSTKRSVEQRLRARTRHGNGRLKRNVVGFDEPLGDIDLAIDECEAADVALVLGTSLRVEPFSEMAGEYSESLAIVNLQPTTTKLDRRAEETGVRLFDKCDVVMEKTMQFLMKDPTYHVPQWNGQHPRSVFVPEHESSNLVNVLAGRAIS